MKIRKHKNNQTFKITFAIRSPSRTETHVDSAGKTRKVVTDGVVSPGRSVFAVGSDRGSVIRAFLFGRDASNTLTVIRPV